MEKVLVVGMKIKPQNSLKPKLNVEQGLTSFNSMKVEKGEEASEEKFEANRGWVISFKERSCLHKRAR